MEWLKDNLNLRGLRSLFLRPPKVEAPVATDITIGAKEVQPGTQGQFTPTGAEPNIVLVSEVTDIVVSDNETKTAKIAHVVITADIPEGSILNITIQADAEAKASVTSRIIPAQEAAMGGPIALPKFRQPQIRHAMSGYFDKLGKLIKQRWQWILAVSVLLVYLYGVSFQNVGNIDEIIAPESRELTETVKANIQVEGENMEISYSPTDMGQPKDIFDDDFFTLMRGAAANPYVLNFDFSSPRHLSGIFGQFAMMDYQITVDLFSPDSNDPVHYMFTGEKITTDVELEMTFENAPDPVKRVYIEILQLNPGEEVHIHIRQIKFLP
ncbi:MAG: hypothetical protein L0Z71_16540 [Anaerolineae bacterium]|nr:hypothetical protein [Anaerolineae bacterium]